MLLKRVSVIGLGYVGLPLAVAAANAGHEVIGIDVDDNLIRDVNNHENLKFEHQDLNAQFTKVIQSGKLRATNDFSEVAKSEIIIVCLPTPLNSHGNPDLEILMSGISSVAENAAHNTLVVVESTVFPGTMEQIVRPIFSRTKVRLGYSPERIDPANTSFILENTPKVISAFEEKDLEEIEQFYLTFVKEVHKVNSVSTAEFAKIIENTYRLVNISLVNELLKIGNALNLDTRAALTAAESKPFGFQKFNPSAGAGGHCVPVDPVYLMWKAQENDIFDTDILSSAIKVNKSMPGYVAMKANNILSDKKSTILIYGIAYKAGVADTRESAAIELIKILKKNGHLLLWHDALIDTWNDEGRCETIVNVDLILVVNFDSSDFLTSIVGQEDVQILDCTGRVPQNKNVFYL